MMTPSSTRGVWGSIAMVLSQKPQNNPNNIIVSILCSGFSLFIIRTIGVSNPIRFPSFHLLVSMLAQQSAFVIDFLFDLYAFHCSTRKFL